MMRKMIIDCDTGVDDAQAILLALMTENIEVVAITCVAGNMPVEQAARNTVRVLHAVDEQCLGIPVYLGCDQPLINFSLIETVHTDATKYHGNDGLGDAPDATVGEPPYESVIKRDEKAAVALCRLINENPGEITIVAIGPLTNIALAMRLDSTICEKIKELYIMGGAIHCKGNVTVVGEFNIATDPEAAAIVMDSTVCPTYLMSWETCSQTGLDWDWHDSWTGRDTKVMKFMKQISEHTIKQDRSVWNTLYCPPDVVAMAWALNSKLCTESKLCHCYLNCSGDPLTRGQLIVDWRGLLKRRANITVCLNWSTDVFKNVLENTSL